MESTLAASVRERLSRSSLDLVLYHVPQHTQPIDLQLHQVAGAEPAAAIAAMIVTAGLAALSRRPRSA